MTTQEILQHLKEERDRIDSVIAILSSTSVNTSVKRTTKKRPGRAFLTQAERSKISKRMKTYWANKKQSKVTTLRRAA